MKNIFLTAAISMVIVTGAPVNAQPTNTSDKSAKAQHEAPDVVEFDKQAAQIQENIKTMQAQMDKVRQTQDPQERQKLLQDHWVTMQNNMRLMQSMWGQGMMGCCGASNTSGGWHMGSTGMMGWHGMGGYYSRLTPEQLKQRQYMTDQYLGMQQQMMNHMMFQQNYMMGR